MAPGVKKFEWSLICEGRARPAPGRHLAMFCELKSFLTDYFWPKASVELAEARENRCPPRGALSYVIAGRDKGEMTALSE